MFWSLTHSQSDYLYEELLNDHKLFVNEVNFNYLLNHYININLHNTLINLN